MATKTSDKKRGCLWRWIAAPPYAGIPWLVVAYVLLCCLIYTANGPFTGHIVGFDDQVRMTQVLDLVNGKGWYDRLITRVNAPEGFQSIWTRIVDIPLALTVIVAQIFTDQRTAALAATVIVTLAELILLFYVARYAARPMAGKKEAWLVVLFLMFTSVLNQKAHTLAGFHLGEASHHSWYVILNLLLIGAATRVTIGVGGRAPTLLTALAIGLLLAVGIEGYPMIGGMAGVLAVVSWSFNSKRIAQRSCIAYASGALFSLLLLPVHAPPSHWFDISFAQPSMLGPILVAAAAAYLWLESFILGWLRKRRWTSLGVLAACAAFFAWFLIACFPQILDGPAAALSPLERQLAFSNHPEAWPMWVAAPTTVDYIGLTMPTVLALLGGIYGMWTTRSRRRRVLYASMFGFTAVGGAMAQMLWRYMHHAVASACIWLLWIWQKLRAKLPRTQWYALASFGIYLALGPFWVHLLPAMWWDAPFWTQVVMYPGKIYAAQNPWEVCDPLAFSDYLNKHYDKNALLSVPDWDTATFLYNTDLRIDFLSNFPSQDKFVDNKVFFNTQDMDEAKGIAGRHRVDLVAICTVLPMTREFALSRATRKPTMIEALKEGTPPWWLKPIMTGVPGYYLLFSVDKSIWQAPAEKITE